MNLGEYAESLFTTICIGEGYTVSKPFYHEIRYDLVVDVDNVLQRVQVKSTDHVRPKDNQCQVRVIKLNYKSKYDIFKNNFGFVRHGF